MGICESQNHSMSTFLELGIKEPINKALIDLGYKNPTIIQQRAIPQILSSTDDLKAFAQTGTGKTAAFSLPILELADTSNSNTKAIILSPTRELAVQIGNNIREFAKYIPKTKVVTVYGGANIDGQIKSLKKGAHIVVGTPGRTVDLINRRVLKLGNIQWLVLDEADEMLNMGFKDELDKVFVATPETKQTLLFSATFPKEVESIANNYMIRPIEITSGQKNTGSGDVSHEYYIITEKTRYPALKRIADLNPNIYAIIFCRTRRETQEVADNLIKDGYNADALHGELSQAQRDSVMGKFREKNIQLLVATDVAARGLDVNNLSHVINHKLPDQIENYTHRSGRTGRAGKKGISIVLTSHREKGRIGEIERIIKRKFIRAQIPDGKEICENQLMHLIDKVTNTEVHRREIEAFLPSIYEKLVDFTKEELIQRFVSLEFNSLLSYYENAIDLNQLSNQKESTRGQGGSHKNMTRFFINIGRKDKLNPARLIGLINDQNITDHIEIGAIDILDTFSFFEIEKKFTEQTLDAFSLNQPVFNSRNVNIEITKKGRGLKSGQRLRKNKMSRGFKRVRDTESSGKKNSRENRSWKSKKPTGFGRRRRK